MCDATTIAHVRVSVYFRKVHLLHLHVFRSFFHGTRAHVLHHMLFL